MPPLILIQGMIESHQHQQIMQVHLYHTVASIAVHGGTRRILPPESGFEHDIRYNAS